MLYALIAFVAPGAFAGWWRISGRRLMPAFVLLVVAVVMIGQLPWLVLGCAVAAGALATRRLWIKRWVRSTPFLRGWRVRRWAKVGWDAAASAVGLGAVRAPVAPLTITSVGDKIHALWTLPLGVTFTHVDKERAALAAFFDAPRLDVTPIRPSVVSLVWRWDEPLAAARESEPPTAGTVCLADDLVLGRDENGANVSWSPLSPATHALVVGGTRSGKTNAMQGVLAQAAAMPDVLVCGIDPTGILLTPFAMGSASGDIVTGSDCDAVARGVELLARLVDEVLPLRLEHLRETRSDAIREPSETIPLLLVVLEEYPAFLAACAADDTATGRKPAERLRTRAELYVQRLLAEGLKAAIVLVVAAQRADADVLGGYRRDQMSTRVVFRLESAEGWRMVLPDLDERPADLAPGEGYFATPGHPPTRFRADHLPYARYRDHVEIAMAWRRDHHSEIPI